jgi:adenylate cyclase
MADEGFKRKLAAILSADVEGYSRLMDQNEEQTIRTLTSYRTTISNLVQQYRGRVVDSPGDNILAEYISAVDAVKSAVKIQTDLAERNADLPMEQRMQFRIGISLGDVVEEEGRIYGDGVNIAARVESIADSGGICISGTAYDHVKNKLPFRYEYQGEQIVRNIKGAVRVYKVLIEKDADELILDKKLELPEKPSIAVLPFVNISGDPEQEYFSDGITEDLITDLSKISGLFVIARNSVFIYKGKVIKIAEVGRELGVRYALEGSVRKANDRVRITAQLVDTMTEGHLWAERYDRELKDIFALQDEVTQKIVTALAVKLTEDEQERLVRKYTDNMEAYDYYLQGLEYFSRLTKDTNILAQQMFKRAIDLDPKFAAAYALLGWARSQEWTLGWSQDPQPLENAYELAQRAITLDESLPLSHAILAEVYLHKKQHEKAIAEQEKAITLSPNDADGIADLGGILTWAGRPEETIGLVKKAMRLNPMYPTEYLWNLGHAYFLVGRYEEAIETLKRARGRNPDYLPVRAYLAASYSELGREEEARTEAAEFVSLNPQTSTEAWRHRLPYEDQAVLERVLRNIRKAELSCEKKSLSIFKADAPPKIEELMEPLSKREIEVLHLMAAGLSNREIAEKLFISLNTVKTHTKNINGKLDVNNRTKAVARAKELGVL